MIYPNGRYMTHSPGRHFGPAPGLDVYARTRGDSLNVYVNEQRSKTAGSPDGYGALGLVPAMRSGAMSALVRIGTFGGGGDLLRGGPVQGGATFGLTPGAAPLSLVASISGGATFGMSGSATIRGVVQMTASSVTVTFGGSGSLAMIVPFSGAGSWAFGGSADLKGRLSMSGGWTPFTELSPQGLAAAVWGAAGAEFNATGTMGNKLNTASSGGVDLGALADAVKTELLASPSIATEATAQAAKKAAELAAALSA